ncbi:AI-2E family transporter [Candidatus Saccharibacteria bacterium]|nr:AI-2E family transporter [Candidatus Saccharibacteria bacterium]
MAKNSESDTYKMVKFWMIPVVIVLVFILVQKAATGLIIVGISLFLALALRPLVRKVDNLFGRLFGTSKKHQTASAVMAYVIVVLIIGAIVAIVGPVVVNETAKFVEHFPQTFQNTLGGWDGVNAFGRSIGIADLQSQINTGLSDISNNILGFLGNNLMSSVGGIADVATKIGLSLVLTLLMLLQGPELMNQLWNGLGRKDNKKTVTVVRRVVSRMAGVVSTYVSKQVTVAILDGAVAAALVFVLSLIFGFSQSLALPMGMITMTFYLIPMFGQFIGGTLVTLILVFSNPVAGAAFGVIYIIYAQIENNVIAPKIQGDALQLQALVILGSIVIGMYMFGLLGAIISIPIAGCIKVLIEEYPNIRALRE